MPCIDAAVNVGAFYVLDTVAASDTIDAINAINAAHAAGAAGGAIEATDTIAVIANWLLAVSWQLLPLAAIVIILDFALRRAGPVVRSALWWMVLAKLIVPPGLASPLSIAQLWPAHATVTTTDAATMANVAEAANVPNLTSATAVTGGTPPRVLLSMLLTTWMVGAITAVIVACWRYRRLRTACLQDAVTLADAAPDVHETVAIAVARRLGLSTVPPIFVAPRAARAAGVAGLTEGAGGTERAGLPAVIGFFRPCVVLPRRLLDRPRAEIEHVLLHELAHVRRRDPLASLVCLIAQMIFWFHPAIWCARRRLATLREMACDRTVARLLGDATPAYRRTLILLARSAALGAPAAAFASASGVLSEGPGALGLFQRQSQLVTRLDALARPIAMRRATECVAGVAIALAILVSCVPLASPRATPTASIDVPPLDQLPGSLQKRYAVMRAMALEEQAQPQQPFR